MSKPDARDDEQLTVLFDAHSLGRQQTGNTTYVRELLAGLATLPSLRVTAAVGDTTAQDPFRNTWVRVPSHGLLRLMRLAQLARSERPDVVHAMYFLPPLTGRPTVVTIHDISFERFPQFFRRQDRVRDRLLVRLSAQAADCVVTGSEASRRDLIHIYGLREDHVVAIPYGVSDLFTPATDRGWEPYKGDRPLRVLAVGTLQPRKNLRRLFEALEIVARTVPVHLRVVGPDGFQAQEIRALLPLAVQCDVVGWLDEAALLAEYRGADVFVYPSIYEGFGLPVLEAMAAGTPVVTTTGGSLPEVAGNAAITVDPYDIHCLARGILRVAADPVEALELRTRGLDRAALFSWERCAAGHLAVYRKLAGKA